MQAQAMERHRFRLVDEIADAIRRGWAARLVSPIRQHSLEAHAQRFRHLNLGTVTARSAALALDSGSGSEPGRVVVLDASWM